MKISTRGRYGLRILLDLALHRENRPRMIRDIAESQNISDKYISRLIIVLRKAGMVKSVRGARGGYFLAKAPEDITILDVLEVMEGPLSIVNCVANPAGCRIHASCLAHGLWSDINAEIRTVLAKATLKDLLDRGNCRGAGEFPL